MLEILEEIQKFMKSIQCEIIFMSMFDDIMWRENDNTEECAQNDKEISKYARRFPRGRWSFLGPGLEKTWYKTCSDRPNREWDRTAAMMILHLVTETGLPVFRASSAIERGELDIREYGKKYTRFSGNDRNIELLFRTTKSVNQLSIFAFTTHWRKHLDEDSSEAPSSDDSDSSGTPYAIQTLEIIRLQKEDYNVSRECQRRQDENVAETKLLYRRIHPSKQMRQNPNQQFEGSEDYDCAVDWKQDGNGAKSSRETCRVLRLRRLDRGRIPHAKN